MIRIILRVIIFNYLDFYINVSIDTEKEIYEKNNYESTGNQPCFHS